MNIPSRRAILDLPECFPLVAEEHAAAIGYVSLHWSNVEGAISLVLGQILLGLHWMVSDLLFTNLGSSSNAVGFIATLIRLTDRHDLIEEWTRITKEFNRLRLIRNDAAHSKWMRSGNRHIADGGVSRAGKIRMEVVETSYLNDISENCLKLAEAIVQFSTLAQASKTHPSAANLLTEIVLPGANRVQKGDASKRRPV